MTPTPYESLIHAVVCAMASVLCLAAAINQGAVTIPAVVACTSSLALAIFTVIHIRRFIRCRRIIKEAAKR